MLNPSKPISQGLENLKNQNQTFGGHLGRATAILVARAIAYILLR